MKPSYSEMTICAIVLCALMAYHVTSAVPLPSELSEAASDLEIGRWLLRFLHHNEAGQMDKRRPLSVNQDLMSLADMLQGDAGKKKMLHAQSFLNSIGKRTQEPEQAAPPMYKRGRVSVGIPLETLSSMIAEQRRRKSAKNVSAHLFNVGKRDVRHAAHAQ